MQLFSVQPSFSAVLRSLMAILFSLVLAACGGGGGSGGSSDSGATSNRTATSSPKAPARTLTLEGVAMKGAIANGLIKVYGVEEHASHYQLTASPLAAAVRTKNDGSFRIQFSPTDSQAWVIQLTADEHTTMTCDQLDHPGRSEEHTSELQSRPHLVCRLLLEKKKKEQKPLKQHC